MQVLKQFLIVNVTGQPLSTQQVMGIVETICDRNNPVQTVQFWRSTQSSGMDLHPRNNVEHVHAVEDINDMENMNDMEDINDMENITDMEDINDMEDIADMEDIHDMEDINHMDTVNETYDINDLEVINDAVNCSAVDNISHGGDHVATFDKSQLQLRGPDNGRMSKRRKPNGSDEQMPGTRINARLFREEGLLYFLISLPCGSTEDICVQLQFRRGQRNSRQSPLDENRNFFIVDDIGETSVNSMNMIAVDGIELFIVKVEGKSTYQYLIHSKLQYALESNLGRTFKAQAVRFA